MVSSAGEPEVASMLFADTSEPALEQFIVDREAVVMKINTYKKL